MVIRFSSTYTYRVRPIIKGYPVSISLGKYLIFLNSFYTPEDR